MGLNVRIAIFIVSFIWLLLILRMVKSRRIWERYAIFWVYLGFGVVVFPLFVDVFDSVLYKLGIHQPPNFYFLIGILGVLLILLQSTVEITTMVRRSRDTVQDLAILEERVRRLEAEKQMAGPAAEARK